MQVINIDNLENRQDIIDNRNHRTFYVEFHCKKCGKLTKKLVDYHIDKRGINVLLYCQSCYSKLSKLERYGDETYNNVDKHHKSMRERYGGNTTMQSAELRSKMENTMLERYNVKYSMSNKELHNKHKKTMQLRYGSEYPNTSDILDKKRNTFIEKYGSYMVGSKKYFYDNNYFDSSWELIFYIYHIDKRHIIKREPKYFEYNNHRYYPDFKVGNRYYEIKGEQFIKRYKNGKIKTFSEYNGKVTENSKAKYKCLLVNNVILIDEHKMQKYFNYFYKHYSDTFLNDCLITT